MYLGRWRDVGIARRYYPPGVRKPTVDKDGYLVADLVLNGKKKFVKLHRLVAQAFIDNPEGKPIVNHVNGIKTDNRVENLEWASSSENNMHSCRVLGNFQGEKNAKAVMTLEEVKRVRLDDRSHRAIAAAYGVSKNCISSIKAGRTWSFSLLPENDPGH